MTGVKIENYPTLLRLVDFLSLGVRTDEISEQFPNQFQEAEEIAKKMLAGMPIAKLAEECSNALLLGKENESYRDMLKLFKALDFYCRDL